MEAKDNPALRATEELEGKFVLLNQQLSELDVALSGLQQVANNLDIELHREAIFCLRLGLTFYAEANRAVQAKAYFASAAIGASALEAILLSKCLVERKSVQSLAKYQIYKGKKDSSFSQFVRSMDLGKLLEIANSLSWFLMDGIPRTFKTFMATQLSASQMIAMEEMFKNQENVGEYCAAHLRELRNLLHPAVCLKRQTQPSLEIGMAATFVFLIAFSALSESNAIAFGDA